MFNLKKISIIVVVIILAFIAYSYFISGNSSQSGTGVSKQAVTNTSAATPGSAALDGPGKDFVTQLLAIQNIKFNLDLFSDPVFKGLHDDHRDLVPQESGRPNPFAPLDGDTSGAADGTVSANGGAFSAYGMSTTDASASPDGSSINATPSVTGTTNGGNTASANQTPTPKAKSKVPAKAPIKK